MVKNKKEIKDSKKESKKSVKENPVTPKEDIRPFETGNPSTDLG